jgi:hypothetical protein
MGKYLKSADFIVAHAVAIENRHEPFGDGIVKTHGASK